MSYYYQKLGWGEPKNKPLSLLEKVYISEVKGLPVPLTKRESQILDIIWNKRRRRRTNRWQKRKF